MSASTEMPYFIKASINLSDEEKKVAYTNAQQAIDATLLRETDRILKMATINCILKTHLPYYYWVGFYCIDNQRLIVGPYQGTLGCLSINFGRGVCGSVAENRQTKIVTEVSNLQQGTEHIACDPNSQSEIVVPVFDKANRLIAVFDVDSTLTHSFNQIDQYFLEDIILTHFKNNELTN